MRSRGFAPASHGRELSLTFSGGLGHKSGNELFKSFSTTFWTLYLFSIVLFHAESNGEILITFQASIIIRRHSFSLLSI